MSEQADPAYKRRRTQAPQAAAAPGATGGGEDFAVVTPAQTFAYWDAIVEAVLAEFISRGRLAGGDFDAGADQESFFRLISDVCERHPVWAIQPGQLHQLVAALREEFFGFGPLAAYMKIPALEEVMCNRHDEVFVIAGGQKRRLDPSPFRSEKEVTDFLARVFAAQGRALNISNPAEDGHLLDGSRIHAQIPPLAVKGACFVIRKFRPTPYTMQEYIERGMFTPEFLEELRGWISGQFNIVISGSTASGKTTFINAVGSLLPKSDRLIVVENTKELQIETADTVYEQTIMQGAREGRGDENTSITIRDAVRYALRMRPDRIIVGEVRSGEAFDLLDAMNTGHDGSMTTVHANSSLDAIGRLQGLVLRADLDLPLQAIQDLIGRSIDIVIQVGKVRGTDQRRVIEAWQVAHPDQLREMTESEQAVREIAAKGQLRKRHDDVWMWPLFQMDRTGSLVKLNATVPMLGKLILAGQ